MSLPIHIHRTPTRREYTGREASAKFCFRCRKREVQREVAIITEGDAACWYDPVFEWECPCALAEEGRR